MDGTSLFYRLRQTSGRRPILNSISSRHWEMSGCRRSGNLTIVLVSGPLSDRGGKVLTRSPMEVGSIAVDGFHAETPRKQKTQRKLKFFKNLCEPGLPTVFA